MWEISDPKIAELVHGCVDADFLNQILDEKYQIDIAILLLSTRCIRLTSFCTSPLQNFSTYVFVHHCSQCKYFNEKSSNLHSLTRFASQCLPILMEYSRIFTNALENTERAHCNSRKCYRNEEATSKIMWFTYRTSCSSIAYKKSRNWLHWSQPGAGLMTTSRRCRCVEATCGRPTEGICAETYRNCWKNWRKIDQEEILRILTSGKVR